MSEEVKNEFMVDMAYPGYVFVGWAKGRFKRDDGQMQSYCNMYVISPVSAYTSEDYQAGGFKAEKLSCVGPELLDGLMPGERVKLFFDDRKRVSFTVKDS